MGILERLRDGHKEVLSSSNLIGRSRNCSMRLSSPDVSTAHALVKWTPSAWELRDLGSANGTVVDGRRTRTGGFVPLRRDAVIEFAHRDEAWRLADDSPPTAVVIAAENGEVFRDEGGSIPLRGGQEGGAVVRRDGPLWVLEHADTVVELRDGDHLCADGVEYRFHRPSMQVDTTAEARQQSLCFSQLQLVLTVSSDLEDVHVVVQHERGRWDLGVRACHYLLYLLALASDQQPSSPWVNTEEVLRLQGPLSSTNNLNVDVFRLRKHFESAGVPDAQSIVRRRNRQLRLGTDHVTTQGAGLGAGA